MANTLGHDYRFEYTRYRHYFHRIWLISQKPTTKVSLALLLTVSTVIIFAVFAIRPTLITVAQLIKKIDEQEEILSKLKQKASALSSAQQQYLSSAAEIELLYQTIPETYELQSLIKLIEATAAYHNILLSGASFGQVVYQSETAPSTDEQQTIAISLSSIDSDYDKIKAFVNDLANLQRLLIINNLSLSSADPSSGSTSGFKITFNVASNAVYMPKMFTANVTEANP